MTFLIQSYQKNGIERVEITIKHKNHNSLYMDIPRSDYNSELRNELRTGGNKIEFSGTHEYR